ncbi:hypothetical protein BGZ65_003183 [Modicella reniformis]|uniref:FAD-binding domain-containing protein n=1 Tax=Modicella reniformis TaxID=1440133 RepID=A0A9P6IL19_9FUNG|nr:hypothetical protein BGZ65_003183 [Modicella reniformis]
MTQNSPPKVLISGAGLSGLFLAILLEKASISYHVYERAPTLKPLGASLGLNANILPAFEQLGLLEELAQISLPLTSLGLYNENLGHMGTVDLSGFKTKTGYDSYIFHRPDLYNVLLSKVPTDKISFNKKIVGVEQNEDGVTIHTSNGETFHGDILVGSDGAYSTIRQAIYKDMAEKEILPVSDMEAPTWATSWLTTTLPNNRIAFSVKVQLDEKAVNEARGQRQVTYQLPIKYTLTRRSCDYSGRLDDLIENTDPEMISSILLEEKLLETWDYGRTVLIGDACQKMNPSTGQGAVKAFQDAVVLVNCLYDLLSENDDG